MKKIFFLTLAQLYAMGLSAQQPPLDIGTLSNWPQVAEGAISHDGRYALYTISTNIYHNPPKTLMIHAINENWEQAIPDVQFPAFTRDSRQVIFLKGQDSLGVLTLGTHAIEYIPDVRSFELFTQGVDEYLAYMTNRPGQQLILRNLQSNQQRVFRDISTYLLSPKGNTLVYKTLSSKENPGSSSLYWVQLPDGMPACIDTHASTGKLVLDEAGEQLAFTVADTTATPKGRSFWYYKTGMHKAVLLADNHTDGIDSTLQLAEISEFSKDGMKVFFSLQEKAFPAPPPGAVMVDVWSYTDPVLQSRQLMKPSPSYTAVLHLKDRRIVRLQRENESVQWKTDQAVGVVHQEGESTENHWNVKARRTCYIVSTANGERKLQEADIRFPKLSPLNHYAAGLAYDYENLYSYVTTTGIPHNLTGALPIPPLDGLLPYYGKHRGFQVNTWLANEKGILASDAFDIWLLDPAAKREPVNITQGYGRKNNIWFRLLKIDKGVLADDKKSILVAAFDRNNKNSGFYRVSVSGQTAPQLLTMGPYTYEDDGISTIKAKDADIYLVKRGCTTQSPNYFWTRDFKRFTPISQVFPEKQYNWLSAELQTFTTLDGKQEQGILYKPQDFDSAKKYPLIMHYYEKKSQDLNQYHQPARPNGDLDIAWFVSHGYLVFTPDIHYTIGEPGQSAYNSVMGAARYLGTLPYVNASKMGIQGHSFGGYATNYIVTHTDLFAAAVSSSGPSDLVSWYGDYSISTGSSLQYFTEVWQFRIGATLWERPDLYIKNSPIFRADKVSTPLLTVANKRDGNTPFKQGVELFTALRRLGKKCWMLQYDNSLHGVRNAAYTDYVIRMTHFFDHYLKDAPAPVWMTSGIPARLKGIDTGWEINPGLTAPGPGLLFETSEKKLTKKAGASK